MAKQPPLSPWRRALTADDIERQHGRLKLYSMIAHGQFPPPLWLGPGEHVWIDSEVEAWNEARIAALEAKIAARKTGKVVPLGRRRPPQRGADGFTNSRDEGDDTPPKAA
jgi:hypothetical protein